MMTGTRWISAALMWGILFGSMGCTKVLKVRPDSVDPVLSVRGMLSPQRGLEVRVHHTFDPFEWTEDGGEESAYYVEDATIGIYEGDRLIDTGRYAGDGYYHSLFPERIRAGGLYSLKIEAAGYPAAYVARIRIPALTPEVRNLRMSPHPNNRNLAYLVDSLSFEIRNPPEPALFYLYNTYDDSYKPAGHYTVFGEQMVNPCIVLLEYIDNKCAEGEWIRWDYAFSRDNPKSRFNPDPLIMEWLYFHIATVEPEIIRYEMSDLNANGGLFTEPALSEGNVEGGFGHVVGTNVVTVPYKVS